MTIEVHGDVDDGYHVVADEFRRNFAERKELGAACAVVRDGKLVVDLWGGYRDNKRTKPWQRDTLVTVWSTTKGMSAAAMAGAHSRGLFDLDARVAAYGPEFAQAGKEAITVRQLLEHEAGLAVIDRDFYLNGGSTAIIIRIINGGSTATVVLPTSTVGQNLTLSALSPGSKAILRY